MKCTSRFLTLLLFSLLAVFSACQKEDEVKECKEHEVSECRENADKVNIRVVNNTGHDICNLVVNPYNEKKNHGNLKKDEKTCYRAYSTAYSYGYIQFSIGDKEFVLQPIDYVGQDALEKGFYSWHVEIEDYEAGKVSLVSKKEEN
ncbi:hypothetical protein RCC89_20715 [Cytophagaceae bacterium ABcell3]|nr:hypothetical protein RCC89_20715 [Cytophagaceae bacterium ABcell3]